jgi:hypothetical protein
MINLKERLGDYTPGKPLISPRHSFNRAEFTPDIQKDIINNYFGAPVEVPAPTYAPEQIPQQVKNDEPVISPEELARYERMEALMTQPHVLKAIGDAVLAQTQTANTQNTNVGAPPQSPAGAQQIEPPQGQQAQQREQIDPNEFINNLWEDLKGQTANVEINQNEQPVMNAYTPPVVPQEPQRPSLAEQLNQEQQQMLAMAQQAGINPQEFSLFMEGLSPQDFINLYNNNKLAKTNTQQTAQAPQANLAETPGLQRVPVRTSYVSPRADVNRFGV